MPTDQKKTPTAQFDRATLGAVLGKIDPSFTNEAFAALLKSAGGAEADAVQKLFRQLGKVILGSDEAVSEASLPGLIDAINASGANGKLVTLAGIDSAKITSMAGADIGVRYALLNGLPFAITDNPDLYDSLNRDGSLYRFDPNTGERLYTDEWLKDRAQFMALRGNTNGEGNVTVGGSQSWVFEERTDAGTSRIAATADQAQRAANKMIFATGTTSTQTIVGGAGTDHVYSGAGDDLIEAGAGDDYVEAGAGDDNVNGGRGNDSLLGGRGEDQLDGGAGNDKLFGGPGADYLVGGQGDDRLDGGDGFDSFVIDAGDGRDVILDADKLGEIVYNGETLNGAGTLKNGAYVVGENHITYKFAGDVEEGGTLYITTDAGNNIKIPNFTNGMLGIKLGDGSPAALAAITDANVGGDYAGVGNDTWRNPEFDSFALQNGNESARIANAFATRRAAADVGNTVLIPTSDSQNIASGEQPPVDTSINVAQPDAASKKSAALDSTAGFGNLFADPMADVPLLSGEQVNQAIATTRTKTTPIAHVRSATASTAFASSLVDQPINAWFMGNNAGISPRNVEYALLDFHDAINIGTGLGGENLGDAASLTVGSLAMGGALDKPQLSDDRYTDLGSKRIGVKG